MSQWFDENGYGLEAYTDYNPVCWEDSDFEPGTVVFMGKTGSSGYKNITHVTLYIGGGYIMHSQAPRGLLGGEGIMIDKLRDMELRYSKPFCSAASPAYHSNFDEEKNQLK
jgi:cell wall-associated NlpC family hydrolase